MKKYVLLFIYLFFAFSSFAQNISVDYQVKVNRLNNLFNKSSIYTLDIKGQSSIYQNNASDSLNTFVNKDLIQGTKKQGDITSVKFEAFKFAIFAHEHFYKSYKDASIMYDCEILNNKKIVIKEALNQFDWKIIPSKDSTILGYKCQMASSNFRGRTYTAYFCPSLNSFGGPWKFDGLPGLILSVQSTDDYFVISPIKIAINMQKEGIKNPFENTKQDEIQSLESYVKKVNENRHKILKKLKSMSDNGDSGKVSKPDWIEDFGIEEISFGENKK